MTNARGLLVLVAILSLTGCCKAPTPEAHPEDHPPPQAEPTEQEEPAPVPQPDLQDPNQMAPDGLPVVIPPPGSRPPSVAEWNGVQREVRVQGSSALGCETKMLREWLRVSCRARPGQMPPVSVSTVSHGGQQHYPGMYGTTASLVVQVVPGKPYRASYRWADDSGNFDAQFLVVNWPAGAPRPTIYFEPDTH
jgi:hypothetical protein